MIFLCFFNQLQTASARNDEASFVGIPQDSKGSIRRFAPLRNNLLTNYIPEMPCAKTIEFQRTSLVVSEEEVGGLKVDDFQNISFLLIAILCISQS